MSSTRLLINDSYRILICRIHKSLGLFKKPKIVKKHLSDEVEAAAMKDSAGRVVVVIADDLSWPKTGLYAMWGVYKYFCLKLTS